MEYQLVIQFSADSVDFDALIALEEKMIETVGTSAIVDGHDIGSGEANIFIFTSDPKFCLALIRGELERQGVLDKCTVAHRKVDGENYTVLWPEDYTGEFDVQ